MKRKITNLEQKLIDDNWCLAIKRYTGKHSEKILCYEYHKTSDLRHDNKTYDLFIRLDQKRSQITKYGINNLVVETLDDEELTHIRFVFLELRHYVERITGKRQPRPIEPLLNQPSQELSNDQVVQMCEEIEKCH